MGDISSGAAGDIKHITKLARQMVCDLGMSPLGPIAYGESQDTVFLGRDITRQEHVSEDTARKIDAEVHRIISEQYERARVIITEHRVVLDKIAQALLEYETIEGRHVQEIMEFGEIRSPVLRLAPPPASDKTGDRKAADKPAQPEPIAPGGHAPAPTLA